MMMYIQQYTTDCIMHQSSADSLRPVADQHSIEHLTHAHRTRSGSRTAACHPL